MNFFDQYKKVLIGILVLVVGFFFAKDYFFKPALITVSGIGETTTKAAKVNFVFTVLSAGSDASSTIDANSLAVDGLVNTVKATLGKDATIKRGNYQVTPQADQYVAVTGVNVETTNLALVPELVKSLYKNGASTVSSLSYEPADKYGVDSAARKMAVAEANKNAQSVAKSAGKMLGRIVSVVDDDTLSSGGSVSDVTNKKELEAMIVSKKVNVVYEIW